MLAWGVGMRDSKCNHRWAFTRIVYGDIHSELGNRYRDMWFEYKCGKCGEKKLDDKDWYSGDDMVSSQTPW